jgi:putative addiction module component (TIGR02574 family)
VQPGLVAAALGDGRHTRVLLQSGGVGKALASLAKSDQKPRHESRSSARQRSEELVVGQRGRKVGDRGVVALDVRARPRGRGSLRGAIVVSEDCARYASRMASALPMPPPGFDDLTPDEKVRYVGALWDRIVADQDSLALSDAQRVLIRERLAAHEANPSAALPWSEVRPRIQQELSRRRPR